MPGIIKITITILMVSILVSCMGSGGGGGGNNNPPVVPDTTPPSNVSNVSADPVISGNAIDFLWTNPADSDFAGVVIVRSTTAFPTSPADGITIYTGTGNNYTDTGLTNGTTYYYTFFSFDAVPNYSSGLSVLSSPIRPISKWDVSIWDASNSLYESPVSSGTWDSTQFQ